VVRVREALSGALLGFVAALALACAPAAAAPMHWMARSSFAQPPNTDQCIQATGLACYSPLQYETAYNMKSLYSSGLTGAGKTIVLVDSFGSPTIKSDLSTFDQAYGLPAPPSFKIIQPAGKVPPFNPNNSGQVNWGVETSLDVEYSHAMAPGANILLVETPVNETEGVQGFPQMMNAESYVINHHMGDVISQSFGATEETFPSPKSILSLRYAFLNAQRHDVTVLGASGDGGATDSKFNLIDFYPRRVDSWPSTDPLVTSVGGTQLHLNLNGFRSAPDNVWNDTALLGSPAASGGGLSTVFTRPAFQDGVANIVGGARGTPDVAMSAAVNGGALVYMSFGGLPGPAFYIIGGTSEATPLFAGVVAVADQAAGHDLGLLDPALYSIEAQHEPGLVDVTSGNNSVTFPQNGAEITVKGFQAVPGYDLASGLGTADGAALVKELASGQ
jgi:subtilase family serine protease